MATKAYVLIETAVGKTREVAEALRGLKGVQSADVVTGPYDIIAVVEGADLGSIGDMVTGEVHTISGITRSVTCWRIAPSIGPIIITGFQTYLLCRRGLNPCRRHYITLPKNVVQPLSALCRDFPAQTGFPEHLTHWEDSDYIPAC